MAKGVKTGGGSRKGKPNKLTASVKDAILAAFDGVGGVAYLKAQAIENPTAFMTLLGKVLPTQVQADVRANVLNGYTFTIHRAEADKPDAD